MTRRWVAAAAVAAGVGLALAGSAPAAPRRHAGGAVSVLYAGSMVNVMEQKIGPAFSKATGYGYQGFGAGSKELASDIRSGLKQADVFISAAPAVNRSLMGSANGSWVSWYGEFASSPLVLGYDPKSRFARGFETEPWWRVLESPGFRVGRTDPALDPKGQLTIEYVTREQRVLRRPDLFRKILGSASNSSQIFPEEALLGRLEAGQLDAGFFYSVEASEAHLPTVTLPLGTHYAARYTVTVLQRAPNPAGALAFVDFLLGPRGAALLRGDGFQLLHGEIGGDAGAAPASVRSRLGAR